MIRNKIIDQFDIARVIPINKNPGKLPSLENYIR